MQRLVSLELLARGVGAAALAAGVGAAGAQRGAAALLLLLRRLALAAARTRQRTDWNKKIPLVLMELFNTKFFGLHFRYNEEC